MTSSFTPVGGGGDVVDASSCDSSRSRWVCEVCTFENVRASVKCSMCRNPRTIKPGGGGGVGSPHQHQQPAVTSAADIFKLGSGKSPPPPPLHQQPSVAGGGCLEKNQAKWACLMCTYLNWPRAARCAQCLHPKRRLSPAVSRNSPISHRANKHHHNTSQYHPNHLIPAGSQSDNNNRSQSTSPPPAPSSSTTVEMVTADTLSTVMESQLELESVKNRNNSTPSPTSTALDSHGSSGSGKWNCVACTYENWPKAKCCVICGVLKGASETAVAIHDYQTTLSSSITQTSSNPSNSTQAQQQTQYSNTNRVVGSSSGGSHRNNERDSHGGENTENNCDYERRLRQFRRRLRETDWTWLSACMGVVEGDLNPVEAYLNSGGDAARKLTNPETSLLNCNRPLAVYEAGHTLVHLAIKFERQDMLATLLSQFDTSGHSPHHPPSFIKCVPAYVAPDLASGIRRHITQAVRQRKGAFPCYYLTEWATYSMPSEIEDLPPATQEQLYNELMDKDAQKELEEDCVEPGTAAINWSEEIRINLGSRLHALWNRSAGDCLLDSVLQSTWGVFDRENALRTAMADSLHEAGQTFYPRWKEWELRQAMDLHYTIDDAQLSEDWSEILSLASKPGASLEQVHVFCLAHVLRRPIIVYGVKYVKSWRGETLGFARFEGVYLPLLWEPSFCSRSPIALGYTRGHFCALVPPEPVLLANNTCSASGATSGLEAAATATMGGGGGGGGGSGGGTAGSAADSFGGDTFLPLVTSDRKAFLPIPYLRQSEVGNTEAILRQWLDVRVTDSGLVVAVQKMTKPPLLVAQMTEEWLNHYRKQAQSSTAPFNSRSATGLNNNNNNNNISRMVRRRSSPLSARRSPCSPCGGATGFASVAATSAAVVESRMLPGNGSGGALGSCQQTAGPDQLLHQTTPSAAATTTVVTSHASVVTTVVAGNSNFATSLPSVSGHVVTASCYSSDGDSDEE